jgi:hypothetical protein
MRPHKAQSIAHLGCYEPIPSPDLPAGSTRGGFVTTPGDPEVSSILTYAVQYLPMPETKECIITVVLRVSPRSSFAYLLVRHERPATAFVLVPSRAVCARHSRADRASRRTTYTAARAERSAAVLPIVRAAVELPLTPCSILTGAPASERATWRMAAGRRAAATARQ